MYLNFLLLDNIIPGTPATFRSPSAWRRTRRRRRAAPPSPPTLIVFIRFNRFIRVFIRFIRPLILGAERGVAEVLLEGGHHGGLVDGNGAGHGGPGVLLAPLAALEGCWLCSVAIVTIEWVFHLHTRLQ